MKKFLVVAFLVIMAFILTHRERVFVRDPLATVYKAEPHQKLDSLAKQHDVQVYINYSNDVLLVKKEEPGAYRLLVQKWDRTPGLPVRLRCMEFMACLTDADHADLVPLSSDRSDGYDPKTRMSNREVSFQTPDGSAYKVTLR